MTVTEVIGPVTGNLVGIVRDAATNAPLMEATLTLYQGDDVIRQTDTTREGEYTFNEIPAGTYRITVARVGYITETYSNVQVTSNETTTHNVWLSAVLAQDDIRIVLTWNEHPHDLDSHLYGFTLGGSPFHIWYQNPEFSDGQIVATLDQDVLEGFGPETITIQGQLMGYTYRVHRYSGQGSLADSGAEVKVYQGEALVSTYHVPTNLVGDWWTVIQSNTGSIGGTVTDGINPISDADVSIVFSGGTVSAITNHDGTYTIPSVPAGTHTLIVTATGYEEGRVSVTVTTGEQAVADFVMHVVSPGSANVAVNASSVTNIVEFTFWNEILSAEIDKTAAWFPVVTLTDGTTYKIWIVDSDERYSMCLHEIEYVSGNSVGVFTMGADPGTEYIWTVYYGDDFDQVLETNRFVWPEDITPPSFLGGYPEIRNTTVNSAQLAVKVNEIGWIKYVVLAAADAEEYAPSSSQEVKDWVLNPLQYPDVQSWSGWLDVWDEESTKVIDALTKNTTSMLLPRTDQIILA